MPIAKDIPLEVAALVGCAVMTGVGAVMNTAHVPPGASTLVIGAGGIGLNCIMGLQLVGAHPIIVADIHDSKLETATDFGATHVINSGSVDLVEAVKELTGDGVDFAFEAVGSEQLQMQALKMTRRGGTTVLVGVADRGTRLALPAMRTVMEDRTVKGSYYGSARVTRDFPRFIELIETGRVDLGGMVTKHFSLEEVNQALAAMRDGEVVRGVLMSS